VRHGRRSLLKLGKANVNLYAAIDIMEGKAVRLERGDFGRRTTYGEDPLEAARRWVSEGARFLHVVDLDGARRGEPVSLDHLRRIAAELGDATELIEHGGGLRSSEAVDAALDAGADRVVVGTAAYTQPGLLEELLGSHRDRVAVAVDARSGNIAVEGWSERTDESVDAAISGLAERGVRTVIYTDTERDGTLAGVSTPMVERVSKAAGATRVLYSGGIGGLDDLRRIAALELHNLDGVIVGKALYEERFGVREGQEALDRCS
jgi:phosphoribosylformimino-5-aminoimidazole carboxamide ribotide isomerase